VKLAAGIVDHAGNLRNSFGVAAPPYGSVAAIIVIASLAAYPSLW
jgi:hypothetical protein